MDQGRRARRRKWRLNGAWLRKLTMRRARSRKQHKIRHLTPALGLLNFLTPLLLLGPPAPGPEDPPDPGYSTTPVATASWAVTGTSSSGGIVSSGSFGDWKPLR